MGEVNMKLKEQIDRVMSEYAPKVEQAILDGDFKIIERGKHTIAIEALGEMFDIWDSNGPEHTACYMLQVGGDYIRFPAYCRFMKARKCREILRAETPEQKAARLKAAKEKMKALQAEIEALE
jgi:hypothetical protein